jgi:hypothetical protein
MTIEVENTTTNRGIGDPGNPGTVNVNVVLRGVMGRMQLAVNVPDLWMQTPTWRQQGRS